MVAAKMLKIEKKDSSREVTPSPHPSLNPNPNPNQAHHVHAHATTASAAMPAADDFLAQARYPIPRPKP